LAVPWASRRDVPGGVELVSKDKTVPAVEMQKRLICHVAFGKVLEQERKCPLHMTGVRARAVEQRGTLRLVLTVRGDPDRASQLRRRIKALVP
jgi:hypothetical protein